MLLKPKPEKSHLWFSKLLVVPYRPDVELLIAFLYIFQANVHREYCGAKDNSHRPPNCSDLNSFGKKSLRPSSERFLTLACLLLTELAQ